MGSTAAHLVLQTPTAAMRHDASEVVAPPAPDAYLDLLKQCLAASLYEESSLRPLRLGNIPGRTLRSLVKRLMVRAAGRWGYQLVKQVPYDAELRAGGRDWPWFAYTMIGLRRLDHLRACVEDVLHREVPGDFLEAGVWRGGAAMFMKAVLDRHSAHDRVVWLADSFEGMPKPDAARCPADAGYDLSEMGYLRADLEQVRANFDRFGLLDRNVRFLRGWFRDTMPTAPVRQLALLRIDADLYESTMDVLNALYSRVAPGGLVIIDDYLSWPPCRTAVDDFRTRHGVRSPLHEIDSSGVYWRVS